MCVCVCVCVYACANQCSIKTCLFPLFPPNFSSFYSAKDNKVKWYESTKYRNKCRIKEEKAKWSKRKWASVVKYTWQIIRFPLRFTVLSICVHGFL